MMFKGIISYIFIGFLLLVSCGRHSHEGANQFRADSLCTVISEIRYSDIIHFDSVAKELHSIAYNNDEMLMIANNAMAYSCMMQMDYNRSLELYRMVRDNSACEIERLVADVGLMTVCYRVSANRLFFDYRSSALSRIKRINEEYDYLSAGDKERFNRAKVEFAIVGVCYFSNLAMQKEADRTLDYLEQNLNDTNELSLRLYARMFLVNNPSDVQERLMQLYKGMSIANDNGLVWLEANYRLLLAISLRDNETLCLFSEKYPEYLALLLPKDKCIDELPSILAKEAAEDFRKFGDEYMMIEALTVEASCNTRLGRYDEAMSVLSEAYERTTEYYRKKYPDTMFVQLDSLLYSTNEQYSLATDIESGICHIPECLLSICREASCVYAGMDNKIQSDINRELYLDLLRTTRLNKHLESRISTIEEKVYGLERTTVVILALLLLLAFLLFFVHRRRLHKERMLSSQRKNILVICRKMFSSLPQNVENKQQLFDSISALLNETLGNLSGETSFTFCEAEVVKATPNLCSFDIPYTHLAEYDKLIVLSEYEIDKDKKGLLTMLLPYIAVAIEEGMRLCNICEERERVEEQKRASAIYLAEHKRENILKRVSVSIVSGMRTFIDRISNELKYLSGDISAEDRKRKLQYVSELAEKLNSLNLILERWIKTRQGEVNPRIEIFPVSHIFAIIEKNRKLYDTRGISLDVKPTESIAKADKALTLFMVNTLVDNAAKFTSAGGNVILECIEAGDYVEIAVEDTGIGLSKDDVNRIQNSKVYDAAQIGKGNELLKPKSKGNGFGLMNCKGIIEKYRKLGSLFSACSFNISSTQGKGSRFSFRVPKGVMRCILVLISLLPTQIQADDNVFTQLGEMADSVFMCNVNGKHDNAIIVAQDALTLLNGYYRSETGGNDTLSLSSGAAELGWWRNSIFRDSLKEEIFYNILDIRNEVAVASLSLKDWEKYKYNNNIYTALYRMVHEDKDVADRHSAIMQVANSYEAAIAFSCFLILLMLIYFVISFVRHNIIEKTNECLVLEMNSRLLKVTTQTRNRSINNLTQDIVKELHACLGETMRIKNISLTLNPEKENERLESTTLRIFPLQAISNDERKLVGVLQVITERPLSDDEIVSLELIASYLASVLYHSIERIASGYQAIEELEEEAELIRYEENRLHVQNMVMDNCLSVIKHETVYYPNRIKELANRAMLSTQNEEEILTDMRELMEYYSSVFGILANCAMRELDGTSFRLSSVALSDIFKTAKRNAERNMRKAGVDIQVVCNETDATVYVDIDVIDFLFEQLFAAAFRIKKNGAIELRAIEKDEFVTVELFDNRYVLTNEETADMFTPTERNLDALDGVNAMEYLMTKEIVRLHEDYTGKHGGRMEARSDVSGTTILFTLPKPMNHEK